MQKIELGDFLQVTINSCKLIQIINTILKNINDQETRIENINKQLIRMNDKMQQNYTSLGLELHRFEKLTQKDIQNQRNNNKQIKNLWDERIKQEDDKISKIQNQIIQIVNQNTKKNQDNEIKFLQLEQKHNFLELSITKFAQKEQITNLNEEFLKIQKYIEQLNQNITKKNISTKYVTKKKINSIPTQNQIELQDDIKSKKKLSHLNVSKVLSTILMNGVTQHQNQINSCNQSSQESQNNKQIKKLSYINNNYLIEQHKIALNQFIQLSTTKANQIVDFSNQYSLQLEQFKQGLKKQINDNQYSINIIQSKAILNEQKITTLNRKLQRQSGKLNEIMKIVKSLESLKGAEQKSFCHLRCEIQNSKTNLEKMIKLKLDEQSFEKEKKKIYQKVQFTYQKVYQKADKLQVKKAILFIQQKLKQIIFLISDQKNHQKEGAINRIPLKCLTCDKQFQSQFAINESKTIRLKNKPPKRIQSSHIRRKIRTNHLSVDIQQCD